MEEEKRGRGRPRKNPDEEGLDLDHTQIEGGQPKQENRGRPKGSAVQKEIVADKLNIMADAVFSMLGYDYKYDAADYKKEATALTNLSKDYKIIAHVLEILDPLLIVCGIWQKFKGIKKKPKQQPQKEQTPIPAQEAQPTNGGSLIQFKTGG